MQEKSTESWTRYSNAPLWILSIINIYLQNILRNKGIPQVIVANVLEYDTEFVL